MKAVRPPNILWICTDQQRFDTTGCYGNRFVRTPHIDRLAEQGTLFENAFCQSPVCTPSRASFLTGRYPRTTRCRQNGQNLPENERLVTRLLADAGYRCGLAGKLHVSACDPSVAPDGEPRMDDGYETFHWSHHPEDDWPSNEYARWLESSGFVREPQSAPESPYVRCGPDAPYSQTAWCADMAIGFIESRAGADRPWLCSVNMFDPHHPFDPPARHLQRYLDRLELIPLPNFEAGELDAKSYFQQYDHHGAYGDSGSYPYSKMSDTDHRLIRAAYWAMVEAIDEQVGRMIETLERTGERDNTMVIFMSDHGEMLGDHGIYLKGPHFYEPAVHVPLIVSYPGVWPQGRRCSGLVELTDLAPTLLEAAGLPIHPGMQGSSLLPLLQGTAAGHPHRASVYCEFYNANAKQGGVGGFATMVRTERYKLVRYHGRDEGELYDLAADPDERNNLWSRSDAADVRSDLLILLSDRMAETVDPLPERLSMW
ncbi:sulfatase [Cohnella cellulosilytica]|uniref:Sulfatase n=1 Tax=Cohnella cellulosilytica TaxID=986710 RepID=A0ABW2FBJ1_9BACL